MFTITFMIEGSDPVVISANAGEKLLDVARKANVAIDAPCSGSGTWRRTPDAKFRITPQRLREILGIQAEILEFGAEHTAAGGRLIYITCSVLPEENERQIESFLAKHPEFSPIDHKELWRETLDIPLYPFDDTRWLKFSPLNTKTDGFFFCAMKKAVAES